jgi:hypothetical protein
MSVDENGKSRTQVPELLAAARTLLAMGINVLPVLPGDKRPGLPSWKRYQSTMATGDEIDDWFRTGSPYTGIWVPTGRVSRLVVLDCDSAGADAFWRGEIGEEMDATTCVATSRGHHYWFRTEPGSPVKSWSVHEGDIQFDVLGDGKGVMAPPSPHPSGTAYGWIRGLQ